MNRLLIIGILLLSTMPLYAQAQPPNTAKLKADAQKIVSNIRGDKAKTQAYCQINSGRGGRRSSYGRSRPRLRNGGHPLRSRFELWPAGECLPQNDQD